MGLPFRFSFGATITNFKAPFIIVVLAWSIRFISLARKNPHIARGQHVFIVKFLISMSQVSPHSCNLDIIGDISIVGLKKDLNSVSSMAFKNSARQWELSMDLGSVTRLIIAEL
ncbi:hypothetical protein AYI68_g1223 [Smittium mucronatum]|uniref:Uncharacterized protein n=1 Tax=Smittium mucronatum TaxID=133383 RepID=A0A1R0H689_9FUNG|nr:hypothetical protein AYI68_g1223 [Smittium mucronatum]